MVVSSPTGVNLRLRHVASPRSQSAESVNPNSLMKEMNDADLTDGTIEPILDQIKAEYQCKLALRYAADLQLLPFMSGVTSPIISHALGASGLSQLT